MTILIIVGTLILTYLLDGKAGLLGIGICIATAAACLFVIITLDNGRQRVLNLQIRVQRGQYASAMRRLQVGSRTWNRLSRNLATQNDARSKLLNNNRQPMRFRRGFPLSLGWCFPLRVGF